jgi:hypothetical protein
MHGPYIAPSSSAQQYFPLRPAALPESDDRYPHVRLNACWRVIECRDGIQWILQARNRTETVARADWRGRSYCRTRDALIACCDRFCGPIGPAAAAILAALPWRIGAAVDEPEPVAVAPKVARVPVKALDAIASANSRPAGSGMQSAFLQALARRVARDQCGEIVLPTGTVKAGELAQVLGAIERGRRC